MLGKMSAFSECCGVDQYEFSANNYKEESQSAGAHETTMG